MQTTARRRTVTTAVIVDASTVNALSWMVGALTSQAAAFVGVGLMLGVALVWPVLNRPDFRSYREPCPARAGWADSWSA